MVYLSNPKPEHIMRGSGRGGERQDGEVVLGRAARDADDSFRLPDNHVLFTSQTIEDKYYRVSQKARTKKTRFKSIYKSNRYVSQEHETAQRRIRPSLAVSNPSKGYSLIAKKILSLLKILT